MADNDKKLEDAISIAQVLLRSEKDKSKITSSLIAVSYTHLTLPTIYSV